MGAGLSEKLERDIVKALPMTTVFVNIEPLEDESSFRDQGPDGPSSRDASGNVGLRTAAMQDPSTDFQVATAPT